MSSDALEIFHASAWSELARAATDRAAPLRTLALCTVDTDGHPQARYLILRSVEEKTRFLEFHTDTRSGKWAEIAGNPSLTVLGYDPDMALQIRLTGTAKRFAPETEIAQSAWSALSPWTRSTYAGGPPGDTLARPTPPRAGETPSESETAAGQARFGVLHFRANLLDLYDHASGRNRRARYSYDADGALGTADWVAP